MNRYVTSIDSKGTVAVDDTILVKGALNTAGSRIMSGFVPLFSAEVVERIVNAGYTVSGKTNVGEFGLDLIGEFSASGAVTQDGHLVGASAALVADGSVEAALNVDLNGTPRRAAAISGIDFIKPTYGTVSRYGIIPCACSGEQVGVSAKDAEGVMKVLSVISGNDPKDGTSLRNDSYEYSLNETISGKKICIIKELFDAASDEAKQQIISCSEKFKALGADVETVSFDMAHAAQTAWQILMAAETCNNVSRYDGVKFGYRTPNYNNIDDLYVNTRTEGLNFLTKATILYGSDVLSKNRYSACYDKALRIRRMVSEKIAELFGEYSLILAPACFGYVYTEYEIGKSFGKVFEESLFTAIPNLIGIPAMVTNKVQLMANTFSESTLLSAAYSLERMDG